jgi:hypothetical protein
VQSDSLLNVLRKLPDPELELARTEGFLVFKGKGKKLEVRMEAEVLLPVEQIEVPKKWVSLGPEFSEALLMVQECAIEEDKQKFMATCVNIAPGWMEATDNRTQMMRYTLETGIKQACLIKKSGAKDVAGMGPSKMSETDAWLHFKNSARLVISCRRYVEDFVDLSSQLKVKGTKVTMPKGLAEAAQIAEVFTQEDKDANMVSVKFMPGRVVICGRGVTGQYTERRKVKYDGPELEFMIAPKLLENVVTKFNSCVVSATRLCVKSENWRYVSLLQEPEAPKKE